MCLINPFDSVRFENPCSRFSLYTEVIFYLGAFGFLILIVNDGFSNFEIVDVIALLSWLYFVWSSLTIVRKRKITSLTVQGEQLLLETPIGKVRVSENELNRHSGISAEFSVDIDGLVYFFSSKSENPCFEDYYEYLEIKREVIRNNGKYIESDFNLVRDRRQTERTKAIRNVKGLIMFLFLIMVLITVRDYLYMKKYRWSKALGSLVSCSILEGIIMPVGSHPSKLFETSRVRLLAIHIYRKEDSNIIELSIPSDAYDELDYSHFVKYFRTEQFSVIVERCKLGSPRYSVEFSDSGKQVDFKLEYLNFNEETCSQYLTELSS